MGYKTSSPQPKIKTNMKNKIISQNFVELIKSGMTLEQAWRLIFPNIAYDVFVTEIYNSLRK